MDHPGAARNLSSLDGRLDDGFDPERYNPTILDTAGVSVADPEVGCRIDVEDTPTQTAGRSLVTLCEGTEPTDWQDAAYVESYNSLRNTDPREWARTLRIDEFRYTWYPNWDEQLFRTDADPDEAENLAGDPADRLL